MRIFSKQRQQIASGWNPAIGRPRGAGPVVRQPILPVRSGPRPLRPDLRPLPASTRATVSAARDSVREQARRSREEIQALVEEERAGLASLVADSVRTTEERLRGATESRVDIEMGRLREAEERMRAGVAESVRAEVAKRLAELQPDGQGPRPAARRGGQSSGAAKPRKAAKKPAKPAAKPAKRSQAKTAAA